MSINEKGSVTRLIHDLDSHGEFPNFTDRTGLWPLLAHITAFKAIMRIEHERAAKRGGIKASRDYAQSINENRHRIRTFFR